MYRRILAALVAAFVVAAGGAAISGAQVGQPPATPTEQQVPQPPARCVVSQRHFRWYARAVYRRAKVSQHALGKLDAMRECAPTPKAAKQELRFQHHQGAARKQRAVIASLTPFPGPHGTHWAIPYAIVGCEGGWNGWGKFNNAGSGAAGPYQLLGWGAPMPAWTRSAQMAHHRIARRLYLTQGTSPWDSSRSCWGSRV
jgi:hypothetical protein